MPGWVREARGPVTCWICEPLRVACEVEAGFTTRDGGVSPQPWASLNLGRRVGDDAGRVRQNWHRLFDAWEIDPESVRGAEQVHGTVVLPAGQEPFPAYQAGADGLVDPVGRRVLVTLHADCAPVYIAAPGEPAAALVHAGWRGTVGGIAAEGVRLVAEASGCDPGRLYAAIGPCIDWCCYEVGEDVVKPVIARLGCRAKEALRPGNGGRHQLSLAGANRVVLEEAGLDPVHIFESGLCTACHPDEFFSHRRDRGATGRMAAWLRRSE